jgi:hypothetical protein
MTSGARVNLDGVSGTSGAEPLSKAGNNVMKRRQFNVIRSQKYRDRKAIVIDAGKSSGRRVHPELAPPPNLTTTHEDEIDQAH